MIGMFCTRHAENETVRTEKKSRRLYFLLCLLTVVTYWVIREISRSKRGDRE